jgi:hypothetical protein
VLAEERPHRTALDAGSGTLSRRVRGYLGLSQEPPLRRPRVERLEPVRRSWLGAFWHGRVSVRAGVTLDEYLRSRLAAYVASLAVPAERLPFSVGIDEGQLVVRPGPAARDGADAPDAERWLAPLVLAEGPAVQGEVSELELRLATIDGEIERARHRREDLARRLAADVSAGIVVAPPSVDATAEQLGRPAVRSAAAQGSLLAAALAAVVAETWQIAAPLLRSAGVDAARLADELRRLPAQTLFVVIFALGVAVGLFAVAHTAVELAVRAFSLEGDERRRRWLAATSLGAVVFSTVVAVAAASVPGAGPPSLPAPTLVLLLVALPLATALVIRAARREEARREGELAEALAWDRERARALAERARRLEEVAFAEAEERELERLRETARRRLREVSARALSAARLATQAARRERLLLHRVAQSLVAALELDRFEFVRQASARGAVDLVQPRRRKAPDARALGEAASLPAPEPTRAAM